MREIMFAVVAAFALIDGHAALGAGFGCMFYLAMPQAVSLPRQVMLTIASYGLGYSAGVSVYGTDKQMLVSAITAALIVALLTGVVGLIQHKTPEILELLLRLWRR